MKAGYLFKRLAYGFAVLAGVATLIFFLFNILPGDPARMMLGQQADSASVAAINRDLGRDQPIGMQFLAYVNDLSPLSYVSYKGTSSLFRYDPTKYEVVGVVKGPLGRGAWLLKWPYLRRSYQSKQPVAQMIASAFVPTLVLALTAMVFSTLVGILLGIGCALRKDSFFDRLMMALSVGGMSLPSFFAAILVAWLFAFVLARYTGLNMVGSLYAVDDFGRGEYLELRNLVLPAFTLAIRPLAVITSLTRSAMLDTLSADFIRTARAKGLSNFQVVVRHALRNSLNPIITAVTGWFASLMAGAVFIEYIFDWKGIGLLMVNALETYDLPVVMGVVLFVSVLLVIINIFADVAYARLDPRIRPS